MNDNNPKKIDALKRHDDGCQHQHLSEHDMQPYIDQLRAHHEKGITALYKYLKKMDICNDSIASIMMTNALEIAVSAILNSSRSININPMVAMSIMQKAIPKEIDYHLNKFKTELH